jgi:hypothetical protein
MRMRSAPVATEAVNAGSLFCIDVEERDMPVSLEALRSLPIVSTVDQAVDSFLTEWQLAAHGALMSFAPNDNSDDVDRQWWIAFAGNMLWAWTVFVESGPVGPSPYAVVASLLGAALAAGAASKFQPQSPDVLTSSGGLKAIVNALAAQASATEIAFKKGSKGWSDLVLVDYVVNQAALYLNHPGTGSMHPLSLLTDDELRSWFYGNDGGGGDEVIRSKIWSDFVFVSGTVKYETRRLGLRSYFVTLLEDLRDQFNSEYAVYKFNIKMFVADRFRSGHMDGWESERLYRQSKPFVFKPFYGIAPRGDLLTTAFQQPLKPSAELIWVPGGDLDTRGRTRG